MDSPVAATLLFGFVLGMEHALDADHVVAVSTLVSDSRRLSRSALIGISWGIGHTFTLLVAGVLVLRFKVHIPASVALSMELCVGVVLVVLGGQILWQYRQKRVHAHIHSHGSEAHVHFHSHASGGDHDHDHDRPSLGRPLLVGMIHGLAGSAAVMLVVLTTVHSVAQGLLFISLFGVGSTCGMLLMSTVIALPFACTAGRLQQFSEAARIAAGVVSIAVGLAIMMKVGMMQGLFASL